MGCFGFKAFLLFIDRGHRGTVTVCEILLQFPETWPLIQHIGCMAKVIALLMLLIAFLIRFFLLVARLASRIVACSKPLFHVACSAVALLPRQLSFLRKVSANVLLAAPAITERLDIALNSIGMNEFDRHIDVWRTVKRIAGITCLDGKSSLPIHFLPGPQDVAST